MSFPAPAMVLHPEIALNVPNIPSIISTARTFLAMIDILVAVLAVSGGPQIYFKRMSFLTDLTPATLRATTIAVFSAATELTNPLN